MPPVVLFGYDCKTNCSCQRTTQTDASGLASPFTQKVRLVLKLKQIPYSQHPLFHITMMMRNLSRSFRRCPKHDASSYSERQFSFDVPKDSCPRNWSRSIEVPPPFICSPMLTISPQVYCDTSLIIEVLEHLFSDDHPSIYPLAADGRTNRAIIRGFASYWTDVSACISSRPSLISHEQRPFFRVTTGLIPSSVWHTRFGTDRAGLIGHKLNPDKLEAKIPRNLSGLDLHLVRRLYCLSLLSKWSDA